MAVAEPFYFGAQAAQFGVFHAPDNHPRYHGVLVCPPLLEEQVRTHWALRQLSLRLAHNGFGVLRFDYTATGNSLGRSFDLELGDWEQDICHAVEALRDQMPVDSSISMFSTRLSAALLSRVVDHLGPLESVIYWDPVWRGQDWLAHIDRICALMNRELGQRRFAEGELLGQLFNHRMLSNLREITGEPLSSPNSRAIFGGGLESMNEFHFEQHVSLPGSYKWLASDSQTIYAHNVVDQALEWFCQL